MDNNTLDNQETRRAFAEHDRQVTISNFKVACTIGMVLMPAGVVLDSYMYPKMAGQFLQLRLLCSALIAGFLGVLLTAFGRQHYRFLGVTLFMLPASFIAWMIYIAEGATSPYYAGLNLVLLVLAFVLHWTFWESLCTTSLAITLYVVASIMHGKISIAEQGTFVNNLYFLSLTGIIVVVGSYFHTQTRFREFALRYQVNRQNEQLDRQYKQLQEAESQLVQSEKLASLGRMSAGIIHEINNPLNFVKTGIYTLKKKSGHFSADQRADYEDILKDVEDGFNRVMTIVSSLRGFTHHDDESREEVAVSALVDESLRFVSHEWSTGVQLEKNLAAGQTIEANKNKLIQVCLNLLENSLDAMKTKTFADGEQPTISISSRIENGKSLLVFRDNGPGIPPENLGKIFDPFFTTKDVGEGMGMGLSISYRIVQQFQGDIRCATEPGKFCEFTLEFPAKA
jgi:two-component system sensor histidine kinase PhcS